MSIDPFNQGGFQVARPIVSGRILLVDENESDLRFYRLVLEGQGYEVSVCLSFDAAVHSLGKESFDFIMVNQGTPAFEGRRVLDRAMQISRYSRVLVVTACIDMPCYMESIQMGAIDYLEKPLAPSALLRIVETYVQPYKTKEQAV